MYSTVLGILLHATDSAATIGSHPGRQFASLALEHRLRRTERSEMRARGPVDLQDGVVRSVAGTVHGRGAAWATIVLVGAKVAVRATADDQGHFLFPRVGAGSHVLFVEVDGRLAERWVAAAEDPVLLLDVDIRLARSLSSR
jgi:hypothetical protein